jgi:hypothetical protein
MLDLNVSVPEIHQETENDQIEMIEADTTNTNFNTKPIKLVEKSAEKS